MQIHQQSTMALIAKTIFCFYFLTKGENQIGDEGCYYLSQAKWIHLQ